MIDRRRLLRGSSGGAVAFGRLGGSGGLGRLGGLAAALGFAACGADRRPAIRLPDRVTGSWIGDGPARGHRLRHAQPAGVWLDSGPTRRCDVLIVGGGIAGLAAARGLRMAGIEDFALLELEDECGGNSRGHRIAGLPCPVGAHYLPLPGAQADDIRDWLVEIGLAQRTAGGLRWDERHLCHAPQERLFLAARWHEGLLPAPGPGSRTLAQYRRFADSIAAATPLGFAVPTARARWTPAHAALDAQSFAAWLAGQGLDDALLLAYLDYCCRDDYGAGIASVSAWAGIHYFASRHGFAAPGDGSAEADQLLTWPDGNAPLVRALAAPAGDRIRPRRTVFRVDEGRHRIDAWAWVDRDPGPGRRPARSEAPAIEHWQARRLIVATPLFVAARFLRSPPAALAEVVTLQRRAPWLVANLLLDRWPLDRSGAPPAWDNVIHGSPSLGYVDARHQSLAPITGTPLLTAYWALAETQRASLLAMSWQDATRMIVDDLRIAHPDLAERLIQADLFRHGHAMAIPTPGLRSSAALAALGPAIGRIHFAHSDLSAYSVFEEAFTRGDAAGRSAGLALAGAPPGARPLRVKTA